MFSQISILSLLALAGADTQVDTIHVCIKEDDKSNFQGNWTVNPCIVASMELTLTIPSVNSTNEVIKLDPNHKNVTVSGSCPKSSKQQVTILGKS